jgi:hypothetical protein
LVEAARGGCGRPADRDTVLAGLEGGVHRRIDDLRSWSVWDVPQPAVSSVALNAADGAVHAGMEPSRLFRSGDGGHSWTTLEVEEDKVDGLLALATG